MGNMTGAYLKDILIKYYGWTEDEVAAKQSSLTHVTRLSLDQMLSKEKFFSEQFKFSHHDFCKMIKALPTLLSYGDSVLIEKEK